MLTHESEQNMGQLPTKSRHETRLDPATDIRKINQSRSQQTALHKFCHKRNPIILSGCQVKRITTWSQNSLLISWNSSADYIIRKTHSDLFTVGQMSPSRISSAALAQAHWASSRPDITPLLCSPPCDRLLADRLFLRRYLFCKGLLLTPS